MIVVVGRGRSVDNIQTIYVAFIPNYLLTDSVPSFVTQTVIDSRKKKKGQRPSHACHFDLLQMGRIYNLLSPS